VTAKTALNAKNLEGLGPERLAELLIEISAGNASVKRRLRMELAITQSPVKLASEVRKRLTNIARSRSFVDRQDARSLADDLESQRRAIVEMLAKADPTEALDLLWKFMAMAARVFERCDDSSRTIIGVFHEACRDIGEVALKANADPTSLADQAFAALIVNDYGQCDDLIRVLAPALGQGGLEHLKQRMIDLSNRPVLTWPLGPMQPISRACAWPACQKSDDPPRRDCARALNHRMAGSIGPGSLLRSAIGPTCLH